MIKNEKHYRITKAQVRRFQKAATGSQRLRSTVLFRALAPCLIF